MILEFKPLPPFGSGANFRKHREDRGGKLWIDLKFASEDSAGRGW